MDRRTFLTGLAGSAAGIAGIGRSASTVHAQDQAPDATPTPVPTDVVRDAQESIAHDQALPTLTWQIATSWPRSLSTLFGAAEMVAQRVTSMTGGKFTITAHPAGEISAGLDILDVVREGTIPMGHTGAYYYINQGPANTFGTTLPFGLTAAQQNGWLYQAGGLDLLQNYFADRYGVIQFPAGNTGVQMGGWFNREIRTVADLDGLRMRFPGLGGQIWALFGVDVQLLAGGDIFAALYEGSIDAAEWVGPADDEHLGLHKAARFYYYPGWWEPGTTLELEINLEAWNALPEEYRVIVQMASYEANMMTMARYDALNAPALQRLFNESNLTLLPFPRDVMRASEEEAFALYTDLAASDSDFRTIMRHWIQFRDQVQAWHGLAETAYMNYAAWSLETFEE